MKAQLTIRTIEDTWNEDEFKRGIFYVWVLEVKVSGGIRMIGDYQYFNEAGALGNGKYYAEEMGFKVV